MTVQKTASAAGLLDALMVLHWFVALMGLQAIRDLPQMQPAPRVEAMPGEVTDEVTGKQQADEPLDVEAIGPAIAPEPKGPGSTTPIPRWLRRFQVWGPISYVKLGLEFLRLPNIGASLAKLVAWITDKLSSRQPLWTRRQARYRASLSSFG